MFNEVSLKNYGPLYDIQWKNLSNINVVIGENGSGKSSLLKSLYCAVRSIEDFKRGNDNRTISEVLSQKIYWTFQSEKIGDLVKKGADSPLQFECLFKGRKFKYSFGKDTSKQIQSIENSAEQRIDNSIFIPAKEVLSLHDIIVESRERYSSFGFDDTYFDLAKVLGQSRTRGKNYAEFAQARENLGSFLGGRIEYEENAARWYFKKGNQRFSIGLTAEGIKKVAILDILLGNRYLNNNSIIFFDEPEAALHPKAISKLLEIIFSLSKRGIQIFLATHSYFVIKKLFLIAQKERASIPFMDLKGNFAECSDLLDGMPDNAIINESIMLYEEEVEL